MTVSEMCKLLFAMKKLLPKFSPEVDSSLGALWCEALRDCDESEIKKAFRYACENYTEWPAPAIIKKLCMGVTKDFAEIGQEVATVIENCISKHGYPNADAAEKEIGELGWEVVKRCGGWVEVCNTEYEQLPSRRKQLRDLAISLQKGYQRDGFNRPHQIPRKSVIPDFLLE